MKNLSQALCLILIAASFIQGSWTQDQSDSPCSELIQQGIYDYYSQSTSSSGYAQFSQNFCNQYNSYTSSQQSYDDSDSSSSSSINGQSSSKSGGGGFNLLGIFGIGGHGGNSKSSLVGSSGSSSSSTSSSSSQVSALGQFLCSGSDSTADASDVANAYSAYIDPNALNAFDECLELNSAGLKVTTTVRSDQAQVTLQLVYVPPVGTDSVVNVTGINISPPNSWSCSGPLWNLAQNSTSNIFTTQSVSMSCERNVSATPFTVHNQSIYARFSSIVVFTTTGTVTRDFIPIYASPPESAIEALTSQITELQQQISDIQSNLPNAVTQQLSALNIPKTESGYVYRCNGDSDYELDVNNQQQKRDCTPIEFQTPFSTVPAVVLSIAEFTDTDSSDHDISILVFPLDITMEGFTLCATTREVLDDYNAVWVAIGSP